MPIIRYKNQAQQTHSPGCWRRASHWQCCIGLVEELTKTCQDGLKFLDSLPEDYQTAENTAAYRLILEQALAKVKGDLA